MLHYRVEREEKTDIQLFHESSLGLVRHVEKAKQQVEGEHAGGCVQAAAAIDRRSTSPDFNDEPVYCDRSSFYP